jgi:hypothetical protein
VPPSRCHLSSGYQALHENVLHHAILPVVKKSATLLLAGWLPTLCLAADFRVGEVEGLFDLTAAYGIGIRVEGINKDIVAIANGGTRTSANNDDGDLNYDKGIVSNAVRLDAELTLSWRQFGAYVRGFALYDYENQDVVRERTPLSDEARDIIGKDVGLLDHYLSINATPAGIPVVLRLGDQVLNWGESTFIRDGIDIINPTDLATAGQPVTPARDLFIPLGMLWGAANITEHVSLEAYYQYEWQPVALPPVGSFFSSNDLIGADGIHFAMLGAGQFSDLGTDLDSAFGLPAGTLGFDQDFMKLPGLYIDNARDGGQFGVTVSTIMPNTNATRLSAHMVRYHSRLPIISGRTASQQAIDATSQDSVDALAASLVPAYESTGLSPAEATSTAEQTAAAVTTSAYANQAGFFVEYPEDITMLGLSFSTATPRRGLLLSGEVSYHRDFPFQIDLAEVFAATLSPIMFNGTGSSPGESGANENIKGYSRHDRTQAILGLTQLFGPRFGAAQTAANADIAMVYVHDMPGSSEPQLMAQLPPGATSWGYRLGASLIYNGVLGGLTLVPGLLWTQDVNGSTPAPLGIFLEGRKSLTASLGASFINQWSANLSYTNFLNGSESLIRDRDLVRFRVSYNF